MSILHLVIGCDTDGCGSLAICRPYTNADDARRDVAGRGWSTTDNLDYCHPCTIKRAPATSSSLMVFNHDATSTREHDQDPPRTRSDAS